MGWRTPALRYNEGVCGKTVAHLMDKNNEDSKPKVFLLSDSNGRNIVKPQVLC